jgi:putative ABC transport system ATP-binding protein
MAESEIIVSCVGVKKGFGAARGPGRQEVLRGVSLSIARGEMLALVGQSGSGKSTLLNIIGGLDVADAGQVVVFGQDYAGLDDKALSALRNHKIGFIFQAFNLLEHLSVLENVMLPAYFNARAGDAAKLIDRARAALTRVKLETFAEHRPGSLSGGQKQRVAIARALFNDPELLLCDEPTGNLDSETGREVIELFQGLHAEGLTLLMVTHEERVAQVAERVVRIADGHISDHHGRTVELAR